MCRKLVVTNEIFLGTRAICYEAYSLPKGEVVELTEKQIKDALKGITTDEVYGLELSEAGELVMDKKTFFTTNMMKKIHTINLIRGNAFQGIFDLLLCQFHDFPLG